MKSNLRDRRPLLAVAVFVLLTWTFQAFVAADEPFQTKEIRDVVFKTAGDQEIKLNLFLPVREGQLLENRATLLYLDSGCWFSNGPGNGGFWRAFKAVEKGYAVASVSHRSLTSFSFPSQVEDVRAAVRFLRAHAKEYGLDPNRFATMGCSSGGHLSLCLGIPDNVSPFDVGDNLDQSSQVQVVIDVYGPSDFPMFISRFPKTSPDCVYRVLGADMKKPFAEQTDALMEIARVMSPITYVDSRFAPTLIFHGVIDTTVPVSQSSLLYEALLKAGVRTKFLASNQGKHQVESLGELSQMEAEIFAFLKESGF